MGFANVQMLICITVCGQLRAQNVGRSADRIGGEVPTWVIGFAGGKLLARGISTCPRAQWSNEVFSLHGWWYCYRKLKSEALQNWFAPSELLRDSGAGDTAIEEDR